MIPTRSTLGQINEALIANEAVFGNDPISKVALVVNSFVPGPDVNFVDLVLASFTGSTPIAVPLPPELGILDNESGRLGVMLKEPVGGYKWICSLAPDPAQIVYGWIVYNDDGIVWFSEILPEPITISAVGNVVELTAVVGYLEIGAYGNLSSNL